MLSANSKGKRNLGKDNVQFTAIPPQDACCSECRRLLDLDEAHGNPSFRRTLNDLINSVNECNMCALFCEELSLHFELDVDIISDVHLDASEVSLHSHDTIMYTKTGYSRPKRRVNLHLEPGSTVWTLIMQHHTDLNLDVGFHVVWEGPQFPAFDRAYWKSVYPIELPARKGTISQWLEKCQSSHSRCCVDASPRMIKPARVIEITEQKRKLCIRLVTRAKLENQNARYVVLSHCWGGKVPHCRTTRRNIHKHYKSIQFTSFPQTFKDAVQITNLLGIGYLWIDSMCIIQDDAKDWERESAKMAAIFQGAILTIAATTAENCYHGLGVKAPLTPAKHLKIDFGKENDIHFAVRPARHEEPEHTLSDSKIHERAWIFQEMLLSQRILHVTHGQLIWQCATTRESEDGMGYTGAIRDPKNVDYSYQLPQRNRRSPPQAWLALNSHIPLEPGTPEHRCLRGLWWSWVHHYCRRKLTVPEDNYAALAGATRLYQKMSDDEPIVGMWKRDLPIHLAWHVKLTDYKHKDVQPSKRIPTWSWLSFRHGSYRIRAPLVPFRDWSPPFASFAKHFQFTHQAMIHDIQICWKGEELTSQPIAASLKIQSYFSRIYAPERLGTGNAKSGDIDQKSLSETPENLALQDKSKVEYSHPTLRYGMRDDLYENHNFRDIWNLRLDPELAASEFKAEYFDAVVLYVYKGRCRGLNDEYGTNVRVNEDSPTWHVVHLLLQRVDDRKDVYKRIGLLHQQLDFKRSKDEVLSQIGEEKEITLI